MKTKAKALVLVLSALLLVVSTVFATMAFLTSKTDVVTNTFTVGNVTITLDEKDVDLSTEGKDRDIENVYHLVPNGEYEKDPTVHVMAKSESCYVFVKVKNDIASAEDQSSTIAAQILANNWEVLTTNNDGSTIYYYKSVVEKSDSVQDLKVFGSFKIKEDASYESLEEFVTNNASITVVAYAIQSTGFDSAEQAWAAAPSTWG